MNLKTPTTHSTPVPPHARDILHLGRETAAATIDAAGGQHFPNHEPPRFRRGRRDRTAGVGVLSADGWPGGGDVPLQEQDAAVEAVHP